MKISGSYENPDWYPKIRYQESLHENEIHFVTHTVPEPSMVVKKKGLTTFPSKLKTCSVLTYSVMTFLVFISICLLDSVNLNVKTHFVLLVAVSKANWSIGHSFKWKLC